MPPGNSARRSLRSALPNYRANYGPGRFDARHGGPRAEAAERRDGRPAVTAAAAAAVAPQGRVASAPAPADAITPIRGRLTDIDGLFYLCHACLLQVIYECCIRVTDGGRTKTGIRHEACSNATWESMFISFSLLVDSDVSHLQFRCFIHFLFRCRG